jgi:protease-4
MVKRFAIWIGLLLAFFLFLGLIISFIQGLSLGRYNIGLVEITGLITSPSRYVEYFKKLEKDPRINAVVVRINSPGGGVAASQEIFDAIDRLRKKGKPVVVSMGAVAASGGYYIACAADKIVADPGTITGSIGVLVEITGVEKLMEKIWVRVEVIKSGKHKDIGSPFRPMTKEERKLLEGVVLDIYDQFLEVVSERRGIPMDSLKAIADGRLFSGRQALKLGLVDSLGSLEVAVSLARELGGIKEEPRILRFKRPWRLIDFILGKGGDFLPFNVLYRMAY